MRTRIYTFTCIIILFICITPVFGEGSQNYNANGAGVRSFLVDYIVHFVYMKPGEKMYVGSAIYQNETDLYVKDPAGNVTNYNVIEDGIGFIKNRLQEISGPNSINSNGYIPIVHTATTEGIYEVRFYGKGFRSEDNWVNVLQSEEDWDIHDEHLGNEQEIVSWDITIANSSGQKINGRVFTAKLDMRIAIGNAFSKFYVLTNNGYQYLVDLNGSYPVDYGILPSNTGVTVNGHTAYSSYSYVNNGSGWNNFSGQSFTEDNYGQVAYRLFYNKPDPELLTYLGLPANGSPLAPNIKNFKFISDIGENTSTKGFGGKFQFDCEAAYGKYRLTLEFNSGNRIIEGKLSSTNTFVWDGKDNFGNVVDPGTFTAKLETLPGEFHLVLGDFEFIENGIKIQHLNGEDAGSYKINYNHSAREVDGSWNGMNFVNGDNNTDSQPTEFEYINGWMVNANDDSIQYLKGNPDQSAGIDSSNGASNTKNLFSDQKALDFWVFDGDVKTKIINVTVLPETRSISIVKQWDDNDDQWNLRPSSVTFDAFSGNSNTSAGNCTVSISNSWSCTINNLPIYDNSGNEIQYVIKERNAPKVYAADPVTVPSGGESVSITNKLVTKKIEISKKWVGDRDNLFETRPQQITFDAYWNDTVYGSCSAKAQDNWKCSIDNLAVYDGSGAAIAYTIKERNVPKAYTADEPVISGENNNAGTLTNTLITKDISVNKVWEDQNNKYGGRPTNLKFDLYLGDDVKDSCTAAENTSWKCTFSGLPVYDALGLELSYTIKENKVPDGYSTEDVVVSGKDAKTAPIINKLITRDITVIKNWTDNNDHDRKRPQSIVLKLYQDNELFSTATLTAAENTLSENVWTYVFQDIPKYNKDGEAAIYSIKEFPAN